MRRQTWWPHKHTNVLLLPLHLPKLLVNLPTQQLSTIDTDPEFVRVEGLRSLHRQQTFAGLSLDVALDHVVDGFGDRAEVRVRTEHGRDRIGAPRGPLDPLFSVVLIHRAPLVNLEW